jgi:hypothetical protein
VYRISSDFISGLTEVETNPYSPPKARLADVNRPQSSGYYVVSIRKFTLLFFITLGLYSFYWFTVNWQAYKRESGENIRPIARAIFSIFFVHSLYYKIDAKRAECNVSFAWSPKPLATAYVVLSIVGAILDRLAYLEAGSPLVDFLGIATLPFLYYIQLIPQKVVNAFEGDVDGESNDQFTTANIVWIVIGVLLWLMMLIGTLETLGLLA